MQPRIVIPTLLRQARRLRRDQNGNVALLFGLCATMLFTAMGAGLDLSRAYLARQKLSQVAVMACQYASRPSVIDTSTASYNGSNGGAAYVTQVNSFIATTWQSQNVTLPQTNGAPFSYTQGGASTVSLSSTVPTMFMSIAGFTTIPIAAQSHCYDAASAVPQRVPNGNSQYALKESFEASGQIASYKFYSPTGANTTQTTPTGYTSATGYTGDGGNQWHISGYCLEQDSAGIIKSNAYDGNFSVELDCDNGSGNRGNSSITTLVYLPSGSYELRYAYSSRIDYNAYDPTYLCGSAASDLSWANNNSPGWSPVANAVRTNQINAYLDLNNPNTNVPPTHTTIDGTQQLSGSNLIDMCVYGLNWVQRSTSISVTTPGYYWLSFAADGTSDSYGGQLDDIRLCIVSCSGSVQDNYTTAWSASNLLFEDNFESPPTSGSPYNTNGNINNSYGTSYFWNQYGNGWGNAPTNQIVYWTSGCPQGNQCIAPGYNSNNMISKPFLMVPGYYQITYNYMSELQFASLGSTVYCGATPAAANIPTLSANSSNGTVAAYGYSAGSVKNDTNTIGVFMSMDQMASTPNRGNAVGSTTSFTNTDGSTTTTPTVAPNGISLTNYNSAQVNPLLDICGYALAAQTRTAKLLIQKPGFYWLTFAALGTLDLYAGEIDDVRITALGSPYMSSPPVAVTIPVPSPQPGSNIYYTGFSIKADSLAP